MSSSTAGSLNHAAIELKSNRAIEICDKYMDVFFGWLIEIEIDRLRLIK